MHIRIIAPMLAALAATMSFASAEPPWHDRLVSISRAACAAGMEAPPMAGATMVWEGRYPDGGGDNWQRIWRSGKEEFRITETRKEGRPPLLFVAYYFHTSAPRPLLRLVLNRDCGFLGGEAIEYRSGLEGDPVRMHLLGPILKARAAPIPYNPAPNRSLFVRRDCTRVALLDNGVNYLLPPIAERLALADDGALAGRDFWDDDGRPFDFGLPENTRDPRRSHFQPPQHGTSVASVFIADAPEAVCPVPYRYAPDDRDNEIGAAVEAIAADGVRVLVLTTGRDRPWPAFREAVRRHPEMLFVLAAGNNGRPLTTEPVYPMAYGEPNMLVVAATDVRGALWPMNNTGEGLVHLAVPAIAVPGLRFDGSPAKLSGTSYAAPRVGALAGVIARLQPGLDGAGLRRAVMDRVDSVVADATLPALNEAQWQAIRRDAISTLPPMQ